VDIHTKIQTLLAAPKYQPLRRDEIAGKLHLTARERRDFRRVFAAMVEAGEVARVRQDRFILPSEADLIAGRIQFNVKGFAFVIREPRAVEVREGLATPVGAPAEPQPDIYVAQEDSGVAMPGDKVLVRLNRGDRERSGKPSGRVIRILERAHDTMVGTLQKTKQFHFIVPDDPRFTRDIYTQQAMGAQVGDKVVVKLADWTSRHINPEGVIIERLGKGGAPGIDILGIIRKHHLPTAFPEATQAEADRMSDRVQPAETAGRLDLRGKFIVTIDPDDAKDFDDAVHVDELPDGGWLLGVHIADVSHYIRTGSALDKEARTRGNSVYLVDRVIPMLPEKLSNGLCSLRPREDRLTLTALIEFTPKLTVRRTEFAESVIHSRHRLTYKEAFALLTSDNGSASLPASHRHANHAARQEPRPPTDERLAKELQKMWRLAKRLREQRFAQGALALDFPETKVRLDKQGRPTHIEKIVNDISHQLIEEFMLVANEAVARRFCTAQVPALYRIHEDPNLDKLQDFRAYAQTFGFKVGDVAHRRELQKLLEAVKGKPEEYAINLSLLRSLKQARYSAQPVGHYGLAKKFYTHFTSPIRRYADLVVHRTLRTLFQAPASGHRYNLGELTKIAEHISQTERIADEAEKESVELKKLEYFQQQLQTGKLAVMDAVVCTVRNFGIFVELPESLVQGLVHISTLDGDFYQYDEARERLVGKRNRRVIQIGDKVRVQVERVDVFKRQIDFRMVNRT
jgi:ribonuclease R